MCFVVFKRNIKTWQFDRCVENCSDITHIRWIWPRQTTRSVLFASVGLFSSPACAFFSLFRNFFCFILSFCLLLSFSICSFSLYLRSFSLYSPYLLSPSIKFAFSSSHSISLHHTHFMFVSCTFLSPSLSSPLVLSPSLSLVYSDSPTLSISPPLFPSLPLALGRSCSPSSSKYQTTNACKYIHNLNLPIRSIAYQSVVIFLWQSCFVFWLLFHLLVVIFWQVLSVECRKCVTSQITIKVDVLTWYMIKHFFYWF